MIEATDRATAVETLHSVGNRTVDVIGAIDNPDRAVPGLDWSVGDVARHVLIALRSYAEVLTGMVPTFAQFVPDLDGYSARMPVVMSRSLDAEPQRTVGELAAAARDQLNAGLLALGQRASDEVLETPWYGAGATITVRTAISLLTGELLIHGLDIARGLGRAWPISRDEALQVLFPSTIAMIPRVVRHELTRDAHGVYRLRFRGGPTVGLRFVNGECEVAPWGEWIARPDVTLSADPVAFLLLGYGRRTQWPLIAQGRLFAYGRKPWLALQLRGLFGNP